MKLPSSDLDGALPLERVLRVLHDHGVAIQKMDVGTRLEKGDALEVALFTPVVPRFIIQTLSRKFDIELTDFYYIPRDMSGFMVQDPGS